MTLGQIEQKMNGMTKKQKHSARRAINSKIDRESYKTLEQVVSEVLRTIRS